YVDDELMASGQLSNAAILSASDGGTLAHNQGWTLRPGEGAGLVALYRNPADAFAKGITVGGIKYMAIKADSRSIYGKKGATGVVLVKTNQAILIGCYNDRQQPGNAAFQVEKLADFLIDNGN
ncbi:hypothetical protein H0H81_000762, partial [Sphagnurus paluster]